MYGDPAQLIPALFDWQPINASDVRRPALIPHTGPSPRPRTGSPIRIVSPLRPWNEAVEAIRSAEVVFAPSLHALIAAESFCNALRLGVYR